jgi:hypothetical protein
MLYELDHLLAKLLKEIPVPYTLFVTTSDYTASGVTGMRAMSSFCRSNFAHASGTQVDLNKSLDGLMYQVIYLSYMPPGFHIVRKKNKRTRH